MIPSSLFALLTDATHRRLRPLPTPDGQIVFRTSRAGSLTRFVSPSAVRRCQYSYVRAMRRIWRVRMLVF
jgi:hypothetical protein